MEKKCETGFYTVLKPCETGNESNQCLRMVDKSQPQGKLDEPSVAGVARLRFACLKSGDSSYNWQESICRSAELNAQVTHQTRRRSAPER